MPWFEISSLLRGSRREALKSEFIKGGIDRISKKGGQECVNPCRTRVCLGLLNSLLFLMFLMF